MATASSDDEIAQALTQLAARLQERKGDGQPRRSTDHQPGAERHLRRRSHEPPAECALWLNDGTDDLLEDRDENVHQELRREIRRSLLPPALADEALATSAQPARARVPHDPDEAKQSQPSVATKPTREVDYSQLVNAESFTPKLPPGVLDPEGQLRTSWDMVMLALLLYIVVFVPIAICFEYEPHAALIAVDLLVDTFFIVDIGLNFRTGFHDEAGLFVMDRARITRRYTRSWFGPDALSSVPMQAIALVLRASGVNAGSLVAVKLVRLLKIGRLTRFKRIKALSTANVASSGMRRVGGLLLFYFIVTHVVACAYWSMASHVPNKPDCDEQLAWGACAALVNGGRVAEQYVHAMHWTLLVMAVNDSAPVDAGQETFSSLVMVLGIFVNSIVIGPRSQKLPNPSITRAHTALRDPSSRGCHPPLLTPLLPRRSLCLSGSCATLLLGLNQDMILKQQQLDNITANLQRNQVPAALGRSVRGYYQYAT